MDNLIKTGLNDQKIQSLEQMFVGDTILENLRSRFTGKLQKFYMHAGKKHSRRRRNQTLETKVSESKNVKNLPSGGVVTEERRKAESPEERTEAPETKQPRSPEITENENRRVLKKE